MKKLITIFLSIALLAASSTVLYSCDKEDSSQEEDDDKKDKKKDNGTGDDEDDDKKSDSGAVADWVKKHEDEMLASFADVGEVSIDTDKNGFTVIIEAEDLNDLSDDEIDQFKDSFEGSLSGASISDLEFDDVPDSLEYITFKVYDGNNNLICKVTVE